MRLRRKQVTYSQRPTHTARSVHARGERQFKTYDTSYIRPPQKRVPLVVGIIVVVVVLVALVWGAIALLSSFSGSKTESLAPGQQTTLSIAQGSGASTIANQLVQAGLISNASDFTKRVTDLNVADTLKPGTYTFNGGTSLDEVIKTLESGPNAENKLTIPEGSRLSQIADAVNTATNGRVSAQDFTQAASNAQPYAKDFPFLADVGTNSLEGFLFPKTYDIAPDATADSIIRTMLKQFQTETASLDWSYPKSKGLSLYDAVKLASIVEKESTGDQHVRSQVAAVFYNRLDTTGAPSYGYLQSDATSAYELGHNPSADEVHANTPYSTYTNKGLPPTPICSPGMQSLQAVMSPDQASLGKYYFFYFDKNGNYSFSQTYEDHMKTFS